MKRLVDSYGRLIDRIRISVTDRCDLRCMYCMPVSVDNFTPEDQLLDYDEITEAVRFLRENAGLSRVRLTGGEPLLRPELHLLVEKLSRLDLDEIVLTTNGQLLRTHARKLREAGLKRVNVSVDSLDPARFREIRRGGELRKTLDGIDTALAEGLAPLKLNVVLMKGWNEEEAVSLVRFGLDRGVRVRFLELMSIGEAGPIFGDRFVGMDTVLDRLRGVFDLEEMPRVDGGTSLDFRIKGVEGEESVIGFVAPVTRPFCSRCGRLRLSASGVMRGCLMNAAGVDLKPILRGRAETRSESLQEALIKVVRAKPELSDMESCVSMHELGG